MISGWCDHWIHFWYVLQTLTRLFLTHLPRFRQHYAIRSRSKWSLEIFRAIYGGFGSYFWVNDHAVPLQSVTDLTTDSSWPLEARFEQTPHPNKQLKLLLEHSAAHWLCHGSLTGNQGRSKITTFMKRMA